MNVKELENKLVAVLGFGVEGHATITYLIKHGIKPVLFDEKSWEDWGEIEKSEIKKLGINFIFGPQAFLELKGFDVVFRSPGIPLSHPYLQTSINDKGSQIIITSQTKWFFEHCPAKIIGVTGTKGKGTTATLIYEILKLARSKIKDNAMGQIFLTGNIGKTPALEILDSLKPSDYVIYELSSFQLQDLTQSPQIGVVLMVTSEHLDYHLSREEYVEAKSAIVKFQRAENIAIINADFENSMTIGKQGFGQKLYFSRQKPVKEGSYVVDGHIVIAGTKFRLRASDLQLRGEHNLENVCAAILAAHAAWADDESIIEGARNFKGLEHRLEFVAEKNSVKFYNDSFSTTPETAIAAISAFDAPEILILGGSSKKSDFSRLATHIAKSANLKAIILIGEESERLKGIIGGKFQGVLLDGAKNLDEVFKQIKNCAQAGDVVLLSPACASFDWFENYKVRGEEFKNLVQKFV